MRRPRTDRALDEPLPLASVVGGQWKARRKVHRTPRRLATLMTNPGRVSDATLHEDGSGTILCIAGDELILVANIVSKLHIFRLTDTANEEMTVASPWATITLSEEESRQSAAIVAMTARSFEKSVIFGETCMKDEGHVVAFSDDGEGFIIRVRRDGKATEVIHKFSTMNFGVTCVSIVPTVPGSDDCQILVGYQTGYLESWKIFRFSTEKIMAKLTWRGVYPNSNWIQNIGHLQVTPSSKPQNTHLGANKTAEETPSKRSPPEANDSSLYLVVTILSPKTPLKTNGMVEVIDIGSLPNDWKHSKEIEDAPGHGHLRAINLGSRWVMPQAGMEILNSGTVSTNDDPSEELPKRANFVPSTATGSICALPQGNCAALADGTVAMISSREEQSELQWGIANDYNQLLLPYPAIGCAAVNWSSSTSPSTQPQPHVACCLRGGSTYVMPFLPPVNDKEDIEKKDSSTVTVFTLDVETHSRYIHGFTAGNLRLSSPTDDGGHKRLIDKPPVEPVLIYGWAGGIIDVFSCELKGTLPCRPMIGPREAAALEELVSNGSMETLSEILSSMEETDPLLLQSAWKRAWEEAKNESLENITASDLQQSKFSGIQALLLLLSTDLEHI